MVDYLASRAKLLLPLLFLAAGLSLSAAALLTRQPAAPLAAEASRTAQNAADVPYPPTSVTPMLPAHPSADEAAPPLPTRPAQVVTIIDGEQQRVYETRAGTVAEVLQEMNIGLEAGVRVAPPPGTLLAPAMVIEVQRPIALTIRADGTEKVVYTHQRRALDVLAEAGVAIGEQDSVTPGPDVTLQPGDVIEVHRVVEEFLFEDEEIPFQVIYQPNAELDLDTKAVLNAGLPGIKRRRIRVLVEDGIEVGREVDQEWIEQEPVNQVIGYGTRITLGMVETPDGPREYWRVVRMRATAYTAASTGKAPDHPTYGITASGRPLTTGIVAVDPHVVPFRSEVYVPGYGIGFAGDTGGGVKGRWIDLGYSEDELVTWNGYADVYYLTPVPAEINYLLPEVLP